MNCVCPNCRHGSPPTSALPVPIISKEERNYLRAVQMALFINTLYKGRIPEVVIPKPTSTIAKLTDDTRIWTPQTLEKLKEILKTFEKESEINWEKLKEEHFPMFSVRSIQKAAEVARKK